MAVRPYYRRRYGYSCARCGTAIVGERAAPRLCDDCAAETPTRLVECQRCGRVGLPERIEAHDC
jgi:DNA-directed RNA polymerase subunit RPC12/RpoP